ncbi:MAG: hypothetical protein WAU42_15130, partial [Solirubrobacteraceae bacterium]
RSLQAQVRDPLWMLSRQWQVGEFAGEDAGSPVQATLGIESRAVTGYRAGPPGNPVAAFDASAATETQVERAPLHLKVRGSVQLGLLFEELALDAGLQPAVLEAFRAAFAIDPIDPAPNLAGTTGLQLRALAAGRVPDGESLYRSLVAQRTGATPGPPLPAEAAELAVAAVLSNFVELRASAFDEPDGDPAWQAEDLQYSFGIEAASTDGNSVVLEADSFPGGHLDWYSFDVGHGKPASSAVEPEYSTTNMLPIHVTFHGMPSDRWWGFEDAKTDFGQLDAQHVDLAKLLVMEFALVYSGDWFFLPVSGPTGVLQNVTTLVVSDTFGERTLIRPVEQYPVQGSDHPWSMFKVSDEAGSVGDFLLLAPTLGLTDDADPVEDVLFLRDAMAAMAWAVEQKLQGAMDLPVDAYEGYLARLREEGQPQPPAPAPDMPSIAYTLEQPPPDNWIPLVPVLRSVGSEAVFRRGTIDLPGPGGSVILLAPHAEVLQPGEPFYLTDRVLTPIGVSVQRMLRRTRLPDGSTVVWVARRSEPGQALGASGLKFDFLRDAAQQ